METGKKQVAGSYGIDLKTFKRWCKKANIETGNSKKLSPAMLQKIKEVFGEPVKYTSLKSA